MLPDLTRIITLHIIHRIGCGFV